MHLHKKDEFLGKVISYVKFSFDREDIREEINNHILDRIEYYEAKGYEKSQAEDLAINAMGDAEEIGTQLNKEHSPVIGWTWKVTNYMAAWILIINLLGLLFFLPNLLPVSTSQGIPKEEIVWKQRVNEKIQIDDRVIKYKDLVYDKSGNLYIGYSYYEKGLWGRGWTFGHPWTIWDNLGGVYNTGGGYLSGGIITRGRWRVAKFNKNASSVIINYSIYDRSIKVEIPIEAGGGHD